MGALNRSQRCSTAKHHAARLAWGAVLILISALHSTAGGAAQELKHSEYEVEAAYLYNFGNFVEWPPKSGESLGDSFPICVLGQDPFGTTLDATVAGESIGGKKVVAKRLSKVEEAIKCRILFIGSSEESQLKEIVSSLDKMSVLTVSDMPEFARRGGMVQFVREQNKVRFEINLTSAGRSGLILSSQLLKLATRVRGKPQLGE